MTKFEKESLFSLLLILENEIRDHNLMIDISEEKAEELMHKCYELRLTTHAVK